LLVQTKMKIASIIFLFLIPLSAKASIPNKIHESSMDKEQKILSNKLAKATWQIFRSQLGGFTALFPGKPIVEKKGPMYLATNADSKDYYMISYLDAPTNQAAAVFLQDNAQSFVAQQGFRISSTKNISFGNYSGKEYAFTVSFKGGQPVNGTARSYAVKKRIFMLFSVDGENNQGNVTRFLNSFKVS
jgi:hypothetical protein